MNVRLALGQLEIHVEVVYLEIDTDAVASTCVAPAGVPGTAAIGGSFAPVVAVAGAAVAAASAPDIAGPCPCWHWPEAVLRFQRI